MEGPTHEGTIPKGPYRRGMPLRPPLILYINSDRYQSRQSHLSIHFTLNTLSVTLDSTLSARKNHEQGLNSLPGQELAEFLQPEGNEARKNSPIFLQQEGNCKENARTQEHRRNSSPETSLEFTFNSLLRRTDSSSSSCHLHWSSTSLPVERMSLLRPPWPAHRTPPPWSPIPFNDGVGGAPAGGRCGGGSQGG